MKFNTHRENLPIEHQANCVIQMTGTGKQGDINHDITSSLAKTYCAILLSGLRSHISRRTQAYSMEHRTEPYHRFHVTVVKSMQQILIWAVLGYDVHAPIQQAMTAFTPEQSRNAHSDTNRANKKCTYLILYGTPYMHRKCFFLFKATAHLLHELFAVFIVHSGPQ